jgi:hypothetical protein
MKRQILQLLFCVIIIPRFASTSATNMKEISTLTGHIKDKNTGLPLESVNITVRNSNLGVASDSLGRYKLRLPAGSYDLIISHIGYKEWQQQIIFPPDGVTMVLNFDLEPMALSLPGVTVTDERGEKAVSEYVIGSRPLRNIPSPLPDVLLSLQTLPGVSSLNDQSSLYNVRGGNFDENLIYINGVEIYQPQLVRKGIAENPSLINPALLEAINLRTGVFPVSYGDKLSSVLDVQYRQEFERSVLAEGEVSPVGINSAFGLRLGKNSWAQIALRRIDYGYLFQSLQVDSDYSPLFTDFQSIFHFRPHNALDVTALVLKASSLFSASGGESTSSYIYGQSYSFGYHGTERFDHNSTLLSISVDGQPMKDLRLKWNGSYFRQDERERTKLAIGMTKNETGKYVGQDQEVSTFLDGNFYSSRLDFQWLVSRFMLINAGVELKYFTTEDSLFSNWKQVSEVGEIYLDPKKNYHRELTNRNGFIIGRFIQSNLQISKRLGIQLGLRWTESTLNNQQLLLPRANLAYRVSNSTLLTFAVGFYAQPPIYKEFQFRQSDDPGLRAQKATQITLGFERILENDISLKVEAYYKKYSDLLSYSLHDVQVKYSGKNDSRGYAYGLDMHAHGNIIPTTENWISYSYLVTREDLVNDQTGYVPRATDKRHQLAIYNEDKMQRVPWSKLFVRFLFGTGYPYTPSKWVWDSDAGVYELVEGKRNSRRLPFYYRVDLGFNQEFRIGEHAHISLREEILNLYNVKNVLGYELAFDRLIKHYLSGRVFNFGIRAEF